MESYDSEFSLNHNRGIIDQTTLTQRLYTEALKEIQETVFSWGGKDVTGDGVDINITFATVRQAFMWADAFGVTLDMQLFTRWNDDGNFIEGTIVNFDESVRVYIIGYQYAIKQLGRREHRSFAFGEPHSS